MPAGHRRERLSGATPVFRALSYPEFWRAWRDAGPAEWLNAHIDALRARYEVSRVYRAGPLRRSVQRTPKASATMAPTSSQASTKLPVHSSSRPKAGGAMAPPELVASML